MASVRFRRRRPGEPVLADDWNTLAETVEALTRVRAGPGLSATFDSAGLLIAMLGLRDRLEPVKITAAPAPGIAAYGSTIRYSVLGLDRYFTADNLEPVYGRPVANDEVAIYPAEVGDLAFIFRNPQEDGTRVAELWILTEVPYRGEC